MSEKQKTFNYQVSVLIGGGWVEIESDPIKFASRRLAMVYFRTKEYIEGTFKVRKV